MGELIRVNKDSRHDPTNNPSKLVLGGFQLPSDTIPSINGKKVLVMDKIIDGVSIIERISRQPYEIEFDCVLREANEAGTINQDGTFYIFPQNMLDDVWQKIWLPDTVQTVDNTYLNKLGICEMVVESVTPTLFRGSKNIGLRITGYENVPGQTLIIS